VTQPVNASDGVLKGFELGFQYFPELSGVFNGLGFVGSYTSLGVSELVFVRRRSWGNAVP